MDKRTVLFIDGRDGAHLIVLTDMPADHIRDFVETYEQCRSNGNSTAFINLFRRQSYCNACYVKTIYDSAKDRSGDDPAEIARALGYEEVYVINSDRPAEDKDGIKGMADEEVLAALNGIHKERHQMARLSDTQIKGLEEAIGLLTPKPAETIKDKGWEKLHYVYYYCPRCHGKLGMAYTSRPVKEVPEEVKHITHCSRCGQHVCFEPEEKQDGMEEDKDI